MEKNINIKSLLKRAGSLLAAYVLVLGSFSAIVPFLFAQKAGALAGDGDTPLYTDMNEIEFVNGNDVTFEWDEAYSAEMLPAELYIFRLIYSIEGKSIELVQKFLVKNTGGAYSFNLSEDNRYKWEGMPEGDYEWCVSPAHKDGEINSCTSMRNFTVDYSAPYIAINGGSPETVVLNSEYNDLGAKVWQGKEDITAKVDMVTTGADIDTSLPGTYRVIYEAKDSEGRISRASRRVNVGYSSISINKSTKIYGEPDPKISCTILDSHGNTIKDEVLLEKCSNITTKGHLESVGSYDIIAENKADVDELILAAKLFDDEADFVFFGGKLIVTPKTVTVVVDSLTKIDGQFDPTFTYKIVDVNGKIVIDDSIKVELIRLAGEDLGEYQINAVAANNKNYIINYSTGVLKITEKPAEIAVAPEIIETVAAVTPTTYYDRVGVVTVDEPEIAETKEVKKETKDKKVDDKKEEVRKTWKIFGFAWYWWGLAVLAFGGLKWWFGGTDLGGEGRDTTNSSDK